MLWNLVTVGGNILKMVARSTGMSPTKILDKNDWSAMIWRISRLNIFKTCNFSEYRIKDVTEVTFYREVPKNTLWSK